MEQLLWSKNKTVEEFLKPEFLAKNLSIHFYWHQLAHTFFLHHRLVLWESERRCYTVHLLNIRHWHLGPGAVVGKKKGFDKCLTNKQTLLGKNIGVRGSGKCPSTGEKLF